MISQRLLITPCGVIRGGTLGFSCHPATGELYFVGQIYVRHWLLTRKHWFSGTLSIAPRTLKPENITKGLVVHCRQVKLVVETRFKGGAEASFEFFGAYPGKGTAVFDLSGEYVRLKSLSGDGVIRRPSIFKQVHVHIMVEDGD